MTNVDQSRPGLLHHLWKSALLSGLLAVVLGVLVLVWPGKSIIVAAVFLGIYLVVSGVAQVIFAFSLPVSAASRILLFVSGAASLVLAVLAFRHFGEGYAILLLAIWIGVGFVFRGVATTVAAVSDPHLPARGWSIFLWRHHDPCRHHRAGVSVGFACHTDTRDRHLADHLGGDGDCLLVRDPQ